jgi:uncharacterized protein (DUF2267 family)
MNYESYISQVFKLPFINDVNAADSAIKTVLGMLASRVGEKEARRLTEVLPSELNIVTLREHQQAPIQHSAEQFMESVATQLNLGHLHAKDLVSRVLHCVKESPEGAKTLDGLREVLPPDLAEVVDLA